MTRIKILYADTEQNNLNALMALFRRKENYDVRTSINANELLKSLKKELSHIVIVDQVILEKIGVDFFQIAKIHFTIAVTASRNLDYVQSALDQRKLFKYHSKPINWDDFDKSIEEASFKLKSGSFNL